MKADNIKLVHRGEYLSYYEIAYSDEQGNHKSDIIGGILCLRKKKMKL